ncbi:MAG: hypothetical protein QXJ68_01035 [Methanocellales archaeon]
MEFKIDEKREKLIKELKSLAGIFGIAVIDKTGYPVLLDGVTVEESASIANINAILDEASKAFNLGRSLQTLIIAEDYKILILELEEKEKERYIIFMNPDASLQMVKSKFKL